MRVGILSYPMLFQRSGGLQIQILETISALKPLGVDAKLVDPNVDSLSAFDVIHVFSAINGNHRIVETAKSLARPVVLSPLIRPAWNQSSGRIACLLEQLVGRLSGWRVQTSYRQISSALANADKIVALGEIERASIKTAFREPDEKIVVIPNGISQRFYEAEPGLFCEKYGIKSGFVLNVAGVNNHKNQSAIVQALKDYDYPIVLIGWCQKEDLAYLETLKQSRNVIYVGPLSHGDPLLSSAYAAAGVFALPSYDEVMPLSIMESLAAGTPVVMTNRHSMRIENSSEGIREHDPKDIDTLRESVLHFLKNPPPENVCRRVVEGYSWENVARMLLATYEQALNCRETSVE
jgi:glycosyltransferase involved in cell wall biosynthesis